MNRVIIISLLTVATSIQGWTQSEVKTTTLYPYNTLVLDKVISDVKMNDLFYVDNYIFYTGSARDYEHGDDVSYPFVGRIHSSEFGKNRTDRNEDFLPDFVKYKSTAGLEYDNSVIANSVMVLAGDLLKIANLKDYAYHFDDASTFLYPERDGSHAFGAMKLNSGYSVYMAYYKDKGNLVLQMIDLYGSSKNTGTGYAYGTRTFKVDERYRYKLAPLPDKDDNFYYQERVFTSEKSIFSIGRISFPEDDTLTKAVIKALDPISGFKGDSKALGKAIIGFNNYRDNDFLLNTDEKLVWQFNRNQDGKENIYYIRHANDTNRTIEVFKEIKAIPSVNQEIKPRSNAIGHNNFATIYTTMSETVISETNKSFHFNAEIVDMNTGELKHSIKFDYPVDYMMNDFIAQESGQIELRDIGVTMFNESNLLVVFVIETIGARNEPTTHFVHYVHGL